MTLTLENGRSWTFETLLRTKRAKRTPITGEGRLNGTEARAKYPLRYAAKQLADHEWLIIVTNQKDAGQALNDYRKRWSIECLFGDAKTRGLNLEDTHLRAPEKLSCLLGVVTLAIAWSYRCATKTMGLKAIKRKRHGRREKSWFRTGLDALRNWLQTKPQNAISAWSQTVPRRPPKLTKSE